ncbi:MAG: UDP-N-acetylmuramate dehydrogenase [Ignavibacteriaceae bacterium]
MNILENISLKNFNTFGIDVKAKAVAEIFSENDLKEALVLSEFKNSIKLVIGGGSNILLTKDFDGLVIKNSIPGINIIDEDKSTILIQAGAGVIWNDLVLFCVDKNFGGIENLSLIPGTAGAAPLQNIGAYGQELKDVFFSLKGISVKDLSEKNFNNRECKFGYRDSVFKNELKGKFVIATITLRLKKNPIVSLNYASVMDEIGKLHLQNVTIRDVSNIVCEIRKGKLPDPSVIGNAGSFFKNPEVDTYKFDELKKDYPDISGYNMDNGKVKLAAGWLIEKCQWKGKRVGNAGTHSKQSLVLVNYGGAKAEEILQLADEIKNSVYDKFGITLHEEINIY